MNKIDENPNLMPKLKARNYKLLSRIALRAQQKGTAKFYFFSRKEQHKPIRLSVISYEIFVTETVYWP